MIGAILGDMIGAPYEFDKGSKTKDFLLFSRESRFTDDTVMTVAVAEALMDTFGESDDAVRAALVSSMQKWGRRYPHAGYGRRFGAWLRSADPKPYGSYGNGSAMRGSSAGWLFDTLEKTQHMAHLTAEVTHNHPEGVKGAEATASVIFLARNGKSKEEIREYITTEFGYDLSRTCDEIRPGYSHNESCQETVPEAITAFLEGTDFEDVIRTAVSLGGDCDTLTCIAGGMAEAFCGVPEELAAEGRKRLPPDMLEVLDRFADSVKPAFHDPFLDGNEIVEAAIDTFYADASDENLHAILKAILRRMRGEGHFIFPVAVDEDEENSFSYRFLHTKDGRSWLAAFTSRAEFEKGEHSEALSCFIDIVLENVLKTEAAGVIINPWGSGFLLTKEMIQMLFTSDGNEDS